MVKFYVLNIDTGKYIIHGEIMFIIQSIPYRKLHIFADTLHINHVSKLSPISVKRCYI